MSNLERLVQKYSEDGKTQTLVSSLKQPEPSRIRISGMIGAQSCFVAAAIRERCGAPQIIVAEDKESAAYMYSTLCSILDAAKVHFFPDSFRRPTQFEDINNTHIQQRTEIINKLHVSGNKGEVLVTYPEALFEKVVDPSQLTDHKIEIKNGEQVDVDTIVEILVEFGFNRVDFVYEPGQFSIRGGIVDIFSYGNEWPYRIELFDDEVESIRSFNPTTQLSEANLKFLSIIPNVHLKFKSEDKVNIFKVFPKDSTVWIADFDMLLDRLQLCFEKAEAFAKTLRGEEDEMLQEIFKDRTFIYPREVLEDVISYSTIMLKECQQLNAKNEIELIYTSKPQPSFNKNFQLLIQDLEERNKEKTEVFLFTESARQIERFYNIFEDLDAKVTYHPINVAIHSGFIDIDLNVACYTDHQIFDRFHKYKLKRGFTKEASLNLKMLRELRPGDFVTHIDHGIGKYSGLEKININGHEQESVRLIYQNNDILYVSINSLHKISKFVGKEGSPPRMSKIGGDAWKTLKRKTKKKVKDMAKELIKLYAQRKASKGFAFPPDGYLQNELEASFIYEDTPDQFAATVAVKEDMQKEYPMDRLVCGDVGFGKTEVAMRGAFKAVVGGKQVAILVPTTILALQHYKTFSERLKKFGVTVDYVNRFRTTAEKKKVFQNLKEGKVDIVIGTHALLNKEVGFKDLGLLVIDEEQKFGVAAKEKLRNFKINVDTLTLTATPIPRTLQFSLMAARDLSIIRTPPPNRQPIHTERRIFNDELIKDAIYYEFNRGGQVFFVHNRVKSLAEITAMVRRLCPDVDIASAHGQMESKVLEKTLLDFIDRKYDVLVCTNIIETGLDIANANTIIINNAHQFGMSDLHQLRGRVGRSNKKAFCYLFTPPISVLTTDARKRIRTLEEFSDLGSGFQIAMKDLDIRGSGNLLGSEQSGFISDIGYETYQKILEEAVYELKENEFKDLFKEDLEKDRMFVREVEVDTDIEMLIPDEYVSVIQERLLLYTELDKIDNEDKVSAFKKKLVDRFGPLPRQVEELFNGLRIRWKCKELGFERFSLKNRKMRCFFVANAQSAYYETDLFKNIMKYVSTQGHLVGLSLKQSRHFLILIKDNVKNLKEGRIILQRLQEQLD